MAPAGRLRRARPGRASPSPTEPPGFATSPPPAPAPAAPGSRSTGYWPPRRLGAARTRRPRPPGGSSRRRRHREPAPDRGGPPRRSATGLGAGRVRPTGRRVVLRRALSGRRQAAPSAVSRLSGLRGPSSPGGPAASPGPVRRRVHAPGQKRSDGTCSAHRPGRPGRPAAASACGSRSPPTAATGCGGGRHPPLRPGCPFVLAPHRSDRTSPRTGVRALTWSRAASRRTRRAGSRHGTRRSHWSRARGSPRRHRPPRRPEQPGPRCRRCARRRGTSRCHASIGPWASRPGKARRPEPDAGSAARGAGW